jgi:predicted TIM-barrel fold metal-dependent hydrolase
MTAADIVDISCLPATVEVRDTIYAKSPDLQGSFKRDGTWDRAYLLPDLIALLDAGRIERVLVPAHTGGEWAVAYETVAEMADAYPDRISGQAGIDPRDVSGGIEKLEWAVTELGFVGAHSYPHWFGLPPDHRRYYPFYAKCVELDVPIQIQVGKAWQPRLASVGHPAAIDTVAGDFPDLRIVCIHTGYPWERELVAVASKHPHVYIGADGLHPRDWARELVDYMANASPQAVMAGREKVLFGTNYPALSGAEDFAEAVAAVEDLELDEETRRHLFSLNARRVYRLGEMKR